MPFEKFIPPRKQKPPQVSIKRTGTISFDNAHATMFGLEKVGHVTLYFDASRKLVGVKPTPDAKAEGAIRVSHRQRVSSVRARQFFETFGLTLERTSRYPVSWDSHAGMAVIALGDIKRRPGRKPKK
ncbi:MAG: hypothetical protein ACM3O7_02030 [Acidobacteriota bacterium]